MIITQILILFFLLGGCSLLKEQSSSEEETFLEKDAMKQKEDHGHLLKKSLILDVNKFELDNGLTVLLMKNSHLPIFSYYTFIGVGSRFEDKGLSGATHFLEHLMFMGAKKYGPGVFSRLIEGNGGASNAFTNYDYTVYYESLPIKALETVVDLEADRLVNLNIGSQDFEDERKVILEERKLRFENSARGKLFLQVMQYMFKGTPYGESVIGKIEDIKSVSRDDINNYFKKYYAPNSALVVIVGDIDVDETIGLIKKYYGPLAKSEEVMALRERKNLPKLFKKTIPQGKYVAMNGKTENPMFYFSYQGVEQGTRKAYVFDLLAAILSAGNSSYFVQKYVIGDRPLLGHIGAFHMELKYDGIFMVGGELLKGVGIEQFRQIFTKDTQSLCERVITSRSLEKAKNQYFMGHFEGLKSNSALAQFIGFQEFKYGDYKNYRREIEIYSNISEDEMINTCTELFTYQKGTYFSIWNKNPKFKIY